MFKVTVTMAIFLFLALPFAAHAQNYPLLVPGFTAEEEKPVTEREDYITMSWESPARIIAGEEVILILRAKAWYSQTPGSAFFMPPVPQGVILTPLRLSDEERQKGIAIKIKIIPLAAGEIVFPARTLQYENLRFNVPLLRVQSLHRRN